MGAGGVVRDHGSREAVWTRLANPASRPVLKGELKIMPTNDNDTKKELCSAWVESGEAEVMVRKAMKDGTIDDDDAVEQLMAPVKRAVAAYCELGTDSANECLEAFVAHGASLQHRWAVLRENKELLERVATRLLGMGLDKNVVSGIALCLTTILAELGFRPIKPQHLRTRWLLLRSWREFLEEATDAAALMSDQWVMQVIHYCLATILLEDEARKAQGDTATYNSEIIPQLLQTAPMLIGEAGGPGGGWPFFFSDQETIDCLVENGKAEDKRVNEARNASGP